MTAPSASSSPATDPEHTIGYGADSPPDHTGRQRFAIWFVITALVLTGFTGMYMQGAVFDCSVTVRGAPGDGTTGGVWTNWVWQQDDSGMFSPTQALTGAGRGDPLWQPSMIVNAAWSVPMRVLSDLTNPVCGYNLTISFGYVFSGLSMFALVYALTASGYAALFSAVAFAFTAFSQMKGEGHVSGVYTGWFALLVLALLLLWRKPSWWRVPIVSLIWAGLVYTDGYYLPFSLVVVAAFVTGATIVEVLARTAWQDILRRWRDVIVAGVAALLLLVPYVALLLGNRAAISAERTRSLEDVTAFSARLFEYFVPPYSNPFMPAGFDQWRIDRLHGSNFTESTLYLGWIALILAAVAVVATFSPRLQAWRARAATSGRSEEREISGAPPRSSRTMTLAVVSLLVIGLAGFLISLPPSFERFGVTFPMPSRFIHAVFPEMRVMSRAVAIVSVGVVALGGIGLAFLLSRVRVRAARIGITALVIVVACAESFTFLPGKAPQWSYSQAPSAYRDLSRSRDVDLVARYPMTTESEDPNSLSLTFQPVLDKPLVNSIADTDAPDDPTDLARGIAELGAPTSVQVLRSLGTDRVLVERQVLGVPTPALLDTLGLSLVRSYNYATDDAANQINGGAQRWAYLSRYYDIDVYRVDPGVGALAGPALGDGWFGFDNDGWGGHRWMSSHAEFTAIPFRQKQGNVTVSFQASAFAKSRNLSVRRGGRTIATFVVPVEGRTVTFEAPVGVTLDLRADPGPRPSDVVPGSTDTRPLTVAVSNVSITVANSP